MVNDPVFCVVKTGENASNLAGMSEGNALGTGDAGDLTGDPVVGVWYPEYPKWILWTAQTFECRPESPPLEV